MIRQPVQSPVCLIRHNDMGASNQLVMLLEKKSNKKKLYIHIYPNNSHKMTKKIVQIGCYRDA